MTGQSIVFLRIPVAALVVRLTNIYMLGGLNQRKWKDVKTFEKKGEAAVKETIEDICNGYGFQVTQKTILEVDSGGAEPKFPPKSKE